MIKSEVLWNPMSLDQMLCKLPNSSASWHLVCLFLYLNEWSIHLVCLFSYLNEWSIFYPSRVE